MITRKYETIVGIFVVVSLMALLVMVLIIARQEGLFLEYVEYQAVFKNVSGLKAGSEVHIAGVTVGNVKHVIINSQGNIVVTFEVLKKYSDWVRWDTKASIGFMGLLGEKSLDLTAGSPDKPPIPPKGLVATVEPLDITELVARAAPSLQDVQKILNNLVSITQGLTEPESDFAKITQNFRDIVTKVNQGKGSLGMFVNDTAFYRETTQTVAAARKFMTDLEQGKGLFGTMVNDPAFREQAQKTLANLQASMANLKQTTEHLKEAATLFPKLAKTTETFLENLNRAGKSLPGLVTTGETLVSDADKVAQAAQKSWFLRSFVPKSQERTLRLDGGPGKD